MSKSYENILREFADHVGLDANELLGTEEVLIDGLAVGLQLDGDAVDGDLLFFAALGTPSGEHLGRIARTLLEANNLWVGTGGATLGVQQATGAVTLSGRMPLSALSGDALAMLLDGFVDTASFWKGFVEGAPEDDGSLARGIPSFDLRA
ncbi:type III secretion system chaperone [Acidovorax sp.]|uniref:type III secretion system chaperone n=1 Tax=Acidovorax sp. TaxID=1872122 RepID=UPI00260D1531|nr:type III secretion system chaperone [Acidovorax sp.]